MGNNKLNLNDDTALAGAAVSYEGNAEEQYSSGRTHHGKMEAMGRGFAGRAGNKHQAISEQHLLNHAAIATKIVEHAVAAVRANKAALDLDDQSAHTEGAALGNAEAHEGYIRGVNFGGDA